MMTWGLGGLRRHAFKSAAAFAATRIPGPEALGFEPGLRVRETSILPPGRWREA